MSRMQRTEARSIFYGGLLLMTVVALIAAIGPQVSAQDEAGMRTAALRFDNDGKLRLPEHGSWRTWPFLGTPVTPNDMNKGEAAFPEFHHVYINPEAYAVWKKTGTFPEGTILAKELVTVGKKKASSGRGYFEGKHNGFEIAHKSKKRYPGEPGNWAYYTFGHHAPPYAKAAPKMPTESCASCHEALADTDMVFTQYYPNLIAAKGGR